MNITVSLSIMSSYFKYKKDFAMSGLAHFSMRFESLLNAYKNFLLEGEVISPALDGVYPTLIGQKSAEILYHWGIRRIYQESFDSVKHLVADADKADFKGVLNLVGNVRVFLVSAHNMLGQYREAEHSQDTVHVDLPYFLADKYPSLKTDIHKSEDNKNTLITEHYMHLLSNLVSKRYGDLSVYLIVLDVIENIITDANALEHAVNIPNNGFIAPAGATAGL